MPMIRSGRPRLALALFLAAWTAAFAAHAEPYRPASDDEVLTRLPTRRADPATQALAALRAASRADPQDAARALATARAAYRQARALGDPRYVGQAQAALAFWWNDPAPPPDIQVMRAVIAQYGQRFDDALADLSAVVQREPGHAQAWSWLASLQLLRGDADAARRACDAMAPKVSALRAVSCRAQVEALTGEADAAARALRTALAAEPADDPALRLGALTLLGEVEQQLGDPAAAETAFEQALSLGLDDVDLRAAHADLLLDQGRPGEVLVQLRNGADADVLLLRLAIAAKAASSPLAARYAEELAARFDAARRRGDATHQKEEARFELEVRGRPEVALALAQSQYTRQRELADARLLLEAALAARQPAAAQPALQWMRASGVQSPRLQGLARDLGALQ
jgi:Tfp pilus assembly protein PilF